MAPMSALTRNEAQLRARLLDVHHYAVTLDLTGDDDTFGSTTVIRFTARTAGDTFVELKPVELRSATLDGRPLDPAALDDNRLPLTGLTQGAHELHLDTRMRYSRTGEGLHRFTDPADGQTYVYSQMFLDDVQRVFPAFDQPDLKAVFEFTVTAPAHWTVLANGITTRTGDGPGDPAGNASGDASGTSTGVWQSAPTPLISTYLAAVAAGPWHSVRTEHAGLPFGIHCRQSLAPHMDADAEEILSITKACFDRYQEKFTEPYPFDSYDQAFVPEFNAGAMENPGLVTFRDEFIYRSAVTDTERQSRAMVIAHEMAHMWFGDLVTLAWFDDIWLNESFAEYMGYQTLTEATRFTDTWTDFGVTRKPWGYDADQRPSTHPVAPAPDDVPDTASALLNFDGISYAKGASALRQLVAWLGEKDFLAGINTHFARHKFANASLADFIDSLAAHTERDVRAWADIWLRTTGIDTLTPAIEESTDGTDGTSGWTLTVDRRGSRPHHIAVGVYDHDPADGRILELRELLDLDVPSDEVVSVGGPRPALLVLNDADLTYAKVRLDETSVETVLRGLAGIPEALTRAVVWNSLRDMVRDGDLHPQDYLTTAEAHLPEEGDLAIVQGVLDFARTQIAVRYLAPQERTAALATLTAIAHDLLRRTEDGSEPGLRLTAVRTLIDSANRPDTIARWLADDTVPGGPALDPELRWRILARLSVLGAVGEDDIDAALAEDPSATGQEGAARCRAALPTAEAKAAAWDRLFHDDSLSNYLFSATAQGFWQPEQAELLQEYVTRYYPEAVALATRRGPAIGEAAGRWAFPAHAVDETNLRAGQACLADPDILPLLRRKLVDQLDDLARALRVRTTSSSPAGPPSPAGV